MSLKDHLEKRQPKSAWMRLMKDHPEFFSEAVTIATSDKHPEGWRAAWLVYHNMHRNDQRIQPVLSEIIHGLKSKESGHQRELLKVVAKMRLDEEHEGLLFDTCLTIWEDVGKQPSVRITAFRLMTDFAWRYPELNTELIQFTSAEYVESLSPGIRHSLENLCLKLKNHHGRR